METYTVECTAIRGDDESRRSVLLVSTNANRDSYLSQVYFYEEEEGPETEVFAEDIFCTDMWKTSDNRHFLCDVLGQCHWQERPGGPFVTRQVTDLVLYAVWGLDATSVYAIGEQGTCLHFDGREWRPMGEGLVGYVHAIAGASETDLYAAGDNGFVAHWDGSVWTPLDLPTDTDWRAVFVRGPGEIDLCGLGGTFLRIADGEIVISARAERSLHAITRFQGDTYVGSLIDGIYRVEGDELSLFKETVKAGCLSATNERLFAAGEAMGAWFNGESWRATIYSKS